MISSKSNSAEAIGKEIFTKGEVSRLSGESFHALKPGEAVFDNDIVKTGNNAKLKVFLFVDKTLVTMPAGIKAQITSKGVEALEGSDQSIKRKKMEFCSNAPDLDERSRQVGGAFIARGTDSKLQNQEP